jgi:hypothetical protein
MRTWRSGASREGGARPSGRPEAAFVSWVRFAVYLVVAALLAYSLGTDVPGILPRLRGSPLRFAFPAVIGLAILWFLWGAVRELRKTRGGERP